MKIIFYSYTGVHSAVIAAAIHLGTLPRYKSMERSQIAGLPLFAASQVLYQLNYIGQDYRGNDLFTLGVGRELKLIPKSIISFLRLYKIEGEIKLINTMLPLKRKARIGERLASLGMHDLGTRLFLHGILGDYERMCQYLDDKQLVDR
ncbi:MAG: DUF3189 family protein [Bacillota bacterium]